MLLELRNNLPFVTIELSYHGRKSTIPKVLVDTGSATSVVAADMVTGINMQPAPEDRLFTIRGVGGSEVVYAKRIDFLEAGEKQVANFEIEVGGMDYGIEMNGTLGMDFLMATGAMIDLAQMEIRFSK